MWLSRYDLATGEYRTHFVTKIGVSLRSWRPQQAHFVSKTYAGLQYTSTGGH
ncbi:hypothetical protein Q31a_08380 [Aureliella helgolandensis]|uniref:Uncharacterized protein n=1 Tax=Aureliella helgolandensis TaxID=2527968 RepID=A0A518G1U7_9BACT|nr:hypothetical protein Q31a_08380 [Aureliella helgolandensis]